MKKTTLAIFFLMLAGLQTVWAQSMIIKLKNNRSVSYRIADMDSISFTETDFHEWIDLGLPSGTLWATCNIGAESPEAYGDYFAWGDTEPNGVFNYQYYKYCAYPSIWMSKYCTIYGQGTEDYKTFLEADDDAATTIWGNDWRMPSIKQMDELINRLYTTSEWTTQNGVNGLKITSRANGNSIFLPAAGNGRGWITEGQGDWAAYWSRTLEPTSSYYAYTLGFSQEQFSTSSDTRYTGNAIRPVRYTPSVLVSSIALRDTQITLAPGDSKPIIATVLPEDAENPCVKWSISGDGSVAYLSYFQTNGEYNVCAVSPGTCTITCEAADGSGVIAECQVTVSTPVTSIKLSETWLNLVVDEVHTLTATVLPSDAANPAVVWTSSDESVATIDNEGFIRALEPGTCTITCSSTDGSGVVATCKLIVQNYLGYTNGHKWVNLGLPSGTLWATCNVGVDNDDDYEQTGNMYAWGETEPKSNYSWSTYKYCQGTSSTMTKYCQRENYGYNGFTDDLVELQPEDDAATVNWGDGWQTPSEQEFRELFNGNYTYWEWTKERGVEGVKVRSLTSHMSLFLPARGKYADYWTRTLNSSYVTGAMMFSSNSTYPVSFSVYLRYFGESVRPVRVNTQGPVPVGNIILSKEQISVTSGNSARLASLVTATVLPAFAANKEVTWESTDPSVLSIDENEVYKALNPGTCSIICQATDGSGVTAECRVIVGGNGNGGDDPWE